MQVKALEIPDVKLIVPGRNSDSRGFFSETYNKIALAEHGIALEFVQDNHAFSVDQWTVRGLHCQTPPFEQNKLLRCTHGSIFDVGVDARRGSPTYGQHVSAIVSAREWNQILIPIGFVHGYCTLEPCTEVIYKVDNYYSAAHEVGVLWNDPELAIDWPVAKNTVAVSERDRQWPKLDDFPNPFRYSGGE